MHALIGKGETMLKKYLISIGIIFLTLLTPPIVFGGDAAGKIAFYSNRQINYLGF